MVHCNSVLVRATARAPPDVGAQRQRRLQLARATARAPPPVGGRWRPRRPRRLQAPCWELEEAIPREPPYAVAALESSRY
jgi:hypothetical protein